MSRILYYYDPTPRTRLHPRYTSQLIKGILYAIALVCGGIFALYATYIMFILMCIDGVM